MSHSCRDKGHCWHLADGTLYSRDSTQAHDATADCVCCWCGAPQALPLYGRNSAGTIDPTLKHGDHV